VESNLKKLQSILIYLKGIVGKSYILFKDLFIFYFKERKVRRRAEEKERISSRLPAEHGAQCGGSISQP